MCSKIKNAAFHKRKKKKDLLNDSISKKIHTSRNKTPLRHADSKENQFSPTYNLRMLAGKQRVRK